METSQVGQTAMQLRLEQCGTFAPSTLWKDLNDDRGSSVPIEFLRDQGSDMVVSYLFDNGKCSWQQRLATLDRPRQKAAHEVALQTEEDDQGDDHGYDCTGVEQVELALVGAEL